MLKGVPRYPHDFVTMEVFALRKRHSAHFSGGPLRRHGGSRCLCYPSNADFILELFLRQHSNTLHDNQASIWPEVLFDCGHSWSATWFTVVFFTSK